MTGRRRLDAVPTAAWPLAVAVVAAAAYAGTLGHGYALDDVPLVRDNPAVGQPGSYLGLLVEPYWPRAQGGLAAGLHRPLTVISLAANAAVAGGSPAALHAGNVLLHALVSALAWLVLRGLSTRYGTALAGALLFAVHPLHVEAVAPISGRAELLAAAGVLAAWLAHRRAGRSGAGPGWAAAAGAAWLAALLSKEHAVVAPAIFWLDDRLARRHGAARWLAYAVALGAAATLRVAALGGVGRAADAVFLDNPAAFAAVPVRLATAAWVQALYAWRFVWPARLSSDWSWEAIPLVDSATDPRLAAGMAFLAGLVALLVAGWRRGSAPLALAAAIWAGFFFPASNLPFPTGTIMAERLAYLPSLGACLLAGHLAATAAATGRRRARAVAAGVALLALLLAARTGWRNPVWRDNATLALHDVTVVPRSAKLQAGAAIVHHDAGRLDEAERAYRRAIAIWPDYAQMHYNLGQLLLDRGRLPEAIEPLARAAALAPGNPRPAASLRRLAFRLDAAGDGAALAAYEAAVHALPDDAELRFNRARALLAAGLEPQARAAFEELARDAGETLAGQVARGFALELAGHGGQAREAYLDLLRRDDLPAGLRAGIAARLAGLDAVSGPAIR